MNRLCAITLICIFAVAGVSAPDQGMDESAVWTQAEQNAERAHEAFSRCHRMVHAWYKHRGKNNWLIPDNLGTRIWRPENAAADNWSFWVISSYLTDREMFNTSIAQTLKDEIRLTTRLGWLPDDFNIDTGAFERPEPDLGGIMFGASEYIKDGLLPIAELLGRTVWFERARGILDDIFRYAPVETLHGKLPSTRGEVNGEMLQNLRRFYFATGDERYKAWAERIGDAYFLDMLPKNNGLPCHDWDFAAGKPRRDVLSLSDHGNEIVFGLSELGAMEHACDPDKAREYLPAMRRMLDTLLDIAVNEHGLWVHSIQPTTGKVLNAATPDTWGYALDAVYTFYLITGEERYRDAVHRALKGINADPKYRDWGGADAFADSIEGGIVLLNRIPEPQGFEWLEATVPAFLAKQREDGIIEGWHGDGNYVRTALMYALMKTCGTYVTDWRDDVRFGAVADNDTLHVLVAAAGPWQGVIHLDYPRHRVHFGLPMNYPRLNEFPEWYTVEPAGLYQVTVDSQDQQIFLGQELVDGLPVAVDGRPVHITVRPMPGPPYGSRIMRIEAPRVFGGQGTLEIPVVIHNETGEPQDVRLVTSLGSIGFQQGPIPADGAIETTLTVDLEASAEAVLELVTSDGAQATHTIRLICDKNLVGYIAFDNQTYKDTPYLWTGKGPISFSLPARKGRPHTLHLLWGSKNDKRAGLVSINGHEQNVVKGGYDGFEWLTLDVPAEHVTGDTIAVEIRENPSADRGAFVSEVRLTSP